MAAEWEAAEEEAMAAVAMEEEAAEAASEVAETLEVAMALELRVGRAMLAVDLEKVEVRTAATE